MDKPEAGVIYSLTGGPNTPSIANGNTWAESEVKEYKKRKLPFECEVLEQPEVIKNPFSGESVELPPDAVAVYDTLKGAELLASSQDIDDGGHPLWVKVRQGLDWFRKNEPDAYMKLLD